MDVLGNIFTIVLAGVAATLVDILDAVDAGPSRCACAGVAIQAYTYESHLYGGLFIWVSNSPWNL